MRLPGKKDQKKVANLGVACYTYYVLSICIQFVWKKRGRNLRKTFFFHCNQWYSWKFFLATCTCNFSPDNRWVKVDLTSDLLLKGVPTQRVRIILDVKILIKACECDCKGDSTLLVYDRQVDRVQQSLFGQAERS